MKTNGKELLAQKISTLIKEQVEKKEISITTLNWKQETDKNIPSSQKINLGNNEKKTAPNTQEQKAIDFKQNTNHISSPNIGTVSSIENLTYHKWEKKGLKEKNEDFFMVLETKKVKTQKM